MIGKRLGGPGDDLVNIFAQNRSINRGDYRVFEQRIADYIEQGSGTIKAQINIVFGFNARSSRPNRPVEIIYDVLFSDGTRFPRQAFPNP